MEVSEPGGSDRAQNAILRYSRVQLCATLIQASCGLKKSKKVAESRRRAQVKEPSRIKSGREGDS